MHITKEIVRHLETVWSARFLKLVVGGDTQNGKKSAHRTPAMTSHALRFAAGKHHKHSRNESQSQYCFRVGSKIVTLATTIVATFRSILTERGEWSDVHQQSRLEF
jgi:hypothetical protein